MADLVSKIDFTFNSTASAPYLFEWQLVNNTYITYSPSNGWNFNLSITKADREHSILLNSITVEDVITEDPSVEEGRIYNTYTIVLPIRAIQKAIMKADSLDYLPIHFSFSFGVGYGVNDNTCYAEGIIYLKLDATTKNLSVIDGNISGTVEDQEHTLQQAFSYKTTTGTNTTVYNDIPTKPKYIFRKSYGTKCWFDLKLPTVIDPNTYPPVNKSISVYINVIGSISATVLNISTDFKTLNCVVDFTTSDKDILVIRSVPYLISNQVDDTSPIVLQTNVNKATGISYKSNNTIQATEFIETTADSILQQIGNRVWAKEFIENGTGVTDIFKYGSPFNDYQVHSVSGFNIQLTDTDMLTISGGTGIALNSADLTLGVTNSVPYNGKIYMSIEGDTDILVDGANITLTFNDPETTQLIDYVTFNNNTLTYVKDVNKGWYIKGYITLPASKSFATTYYLKIRTQVPKYDINSILTKKDYSIIATEFVEV